MQAGTDQITTECHGSLSVQDSRVGELLLNKQQLISVISFDLCVISVDSYGRIGQIFWAIESFPPKVLTLVEHMLMNSTQISLIECHFRSPCSRLLGLHLTWC